MATTPRILAFAGSAASKSSWNKLLVQIAARGAAAAGGEVSLVDLADFPMPLFNQDDEQSQGLSPGARKFKDLMLSHQGFLIASPEYNSSITPLLKNTIDWVSRPTPTEPGLVAFAGKVAVVMSASPGALGGLRGLTHVRDILGNIGTLVLTSTISVPKAHDAFAADGTLKEDALRAKVEKLGADLVTFLRRTSS